MFYSFNDYWRNFGRYQHEVLCHPELEQVFYDFAKKYGMTPMEQMMKLIIMLMSKDLRIVK